MSVRHFLDIDGAATLPTEQLSLVDQAVADLVATRAMGAVHGQAGLGKTFAVEAALARRTSQVSPCWVSFPSRPTMRLVAATLLGELSAEPAAGRAATGSRYPQSCWSSWPTTAGGTAGNTWWWSMRPSSSTASASSSCAGCTITG